MADASPRRRSWLVWLGVSAMLAAHFALALSGKKLWGTTSDEIAHLVSGHAYWAMNDYRLQPENGNLPQRWEGLPGWLGHAHLPPATEPYWSVSEVWKLGRVYFYEAGNDAERLLLGGRAMNLCWSLACGALVFAWTRRLFGTGGAFVALGFYCLDPTFLAHGALATSDMCITFFMLASIGAWWRYLQDGGWRSGAFSALVFGVACVAKFSAVLLLPMFGLLIAARALAAPLPRLRAQPVIGVLLLHGAAAVFIIWAFFGFRYSGVAADAPRQASYIYDWETLLDAIGWQGPVVRTLRAWHALPEAFLYGYTHVLAFSSQRGAFLDGDYSIYGWVRFFPLAFLYKTTLALLAALPVAWLITASRWRSRPGVWRHDLYRVAPLLVLGAVYGVFSLTTHLNIGHRHILPLYPLLFIFTGSLGWAARLKPRLAGGLIALLLAGDTVETAAIHPHELAFFNVLAGGPANGSKHLADSSIDWGQGLPELKIWLDANQHGEPSYLAYFGCGDPDYYGLKIQRFIWINNFHWRENPARFEPGFYCISATMLTHVYSTIRGPWTLALEHEYQSLRPLEPLFADYYRDDASRATVLLQAPAGRWESGWTRFNTLRFARLCYYLRLRQPDANVGYSILIYHLTAHEISAATGASLSDWSDLLATAATAH